MNQTLNTYEYSVAPENIDFQGQITVPSLCRNMINAIGQNIRKEGYGIDVLKRENLSWVLVRSAFEIDERPGLYVPLFVSVWPVPGSGLIFNRCVRIFNYEGREVGRGTTEWCVIDISTRHPVNPSICAAGLDLSIPCKSPRRIRSFDPEFVDSRKVGYSDCDFNGHLNNTRYIEMLYDVLPHEILSRPSPVRLDINYRHEASCGENVSLGIKHESVDEYLFAAMVNDQMLCSASLQMA